MFYLPVWGSPLSVFAQRRCCTVCVNGLKTDSKTSNALTTLTILERCNKKYRASDFTKIRVAGAEFFHTDGRTDGEICFSQFYVSSSVLQTRLNLTFLNMFSFGGTGWHKKTGTFEKPNKNWINPRKKIYW